MKKLFSTLTCLLIACLLQPLPVMAAKKGARKPVFAELSSATNHPLAVLAEMKHWSTPDYTRISLELDRDVTWEAHELGKGKPGRIYIDINHTRLGHKVRSITIGDGLLKGARIGQYRNDVVRVVLDTENIKDYKIFPLSDPARLIIDVKGERTTEISRLEQSISARLEPLPETHRETATVAEKVEKVEKAEKVEKVEKPEKIEKKVERKVRPAKRMIISKIRRIVVDPGHGGHDSGAVGPNGVQEKDVVLAIGLKLRELIREELGLDVVMTRSSDVFIPLEERTAIANKVGADLFVSVHANAALNRNAAGIETYYLNLAKTEKAAQLAAKENGTTLEKVSVLQAILFDLMANYKLNDSAHLANEVQKSLHKKARGQYADVRNLGVKQGPFYVLVGATMPSILVETAFVSNTQEESRLKDPAYQEMTAEGIMEGIRVYISSLK